MANRLINVVTFICLAIILGCQAGNPSPEVEVRLGLFWWGDSPNAWIDGDTFPSSRMEIALAARADGIEASRLKIRWNLSGKGLTTTSRQDDGWSVFVLVNEDALAGAPGAFFPAGCYEAEILLDDRTVARRQFEITPSSTEMMHKGMEAYASQDYAAATDLLEEALLLADKESALYLEATGMTRDEAAARDEALVKADIFYLLAYCYRDDPRESAGTALDKAEHAVREALLLDPYYHQYHGLLGDILRLRGVYAEALEEMGEAIELCEQDIERLNESQETNELVKALASHYFWLGVALGEMERSAEAEEAFSRAVSLDPKIKEAIENLKP